MVMVSLQCSRRPKGGSCGRGGTLNEILAKVPDLGHLVAQILSWLGILQSCPQLHTHCRAPRYAGLAPRDLASVWSIPPSSWRALPGPGGHAVCQDFCREGNHPPTPRPTPASLPLSPSTS